MISTKKLKKLKIRCPIAIKVEASKCLLVGLWWGSQLLKPKIVPKGNDQLEGLPKFTRVPLHGTSWEEGL